MDSNNKAIESAKMALATAASLAASAMMARSLINEFLPYEIQNYFSSVATALRSHFCSQHTIVIEQMEGFAINQMYVAASTYLATRVTRLSTSMARIRVSKLDDYGKGIIVSPEPGQEIIDVFEDIQLTWRLLCRQEERSGSNNQYNDIPNAATKLCSYELSFHKKYKDKILRSYLPYIQDRAQSIAAEHGILKLYTNNHDCWSPMDLHHPATFNTLAMEPELKQALMDDLARFVKRKDYYKKIGKAWKRGYLLYGPPGTGKSSLVAAMANYLKFDIYDLELTGVRWNNALRRLLVGTSNRSIIVVEDIDCSLEIKERDVAKGGGWGNSGDEEKVTLSGLLNFVDGLWSSCGEERIIVFTTNYKERLDPALLRPGRMDMHIHMGYCRMSGLRVLASNYHDVDDHPFFEEIEGLIKEVEVTPAEVAEELMASDDKEIALRGLIDFIQEKKKARGEAEAHEDCVKDE